MEFADEEELMQMKNALMNHVKDHCIVIMQLVVVHLVGLLEAIAVQMKNALLVMIVCKEHAFVSSHEALVRIAVIEPANHHLYVGRKLEHASMYSHRRPFPSVLV